MCARYNSFKRIPVAELISYLDNQGNLTTLSSTCGMLLCTRGEATFRMANLTCRPPTFVSTALPPVPMCSASVRISRPSSSAQPWISYFLSLSRRSAAARCRRWPMPLVCSSFRGNTRLSGNRCPFSSAACRISSGCPRMPLPCPCSAMRSTIWGVRCSSRCAASPRPGFPSAGRRPYCPPLHARPHPVLQAAAPGGVLC